MAAKRTDKSESDTATLVANTDIGRELAEYAGFGKVDLGLIDNFDQALQFTSELLGGVDDSTELGDGYVLIPDKKDLVGVPMLLLDWQLRVSTSIIKSNGQGSEFVVVRAITKDSQRIVFIDGSTGIKDQLLEYSARHKRRGGVIAPKGLRVSEYQYEDEDGSKKMAKTFYVE